MRSPVYQFCSQEMAFLSWRLWLSSLLPLPPCTNVTFQLVSTHYAQTSYLTSHRERINAFSFLLYFISCISHPLFVFIAKILIFIMFWTHTVTINRKLFFDYFDYYRKDKMLLLKNLHTHTYITCDMSQKCIMDLFWMIKEIVNQRCINPIWLLSWKSVLQG